MSKVTKEFSCLRKQARTSEASEEQENTISPFLLKRLGIRVDAKDIYKTFITYLRQ